MLDQMVKLLDVLLSALPKLSSSGRKNRQFARTLLALHYDLEQLVDTGREILRVLRQKDREVNQSTKVKQLDKETSPQSRFVLFPLVDRDLDPLVDEQKTLLKKIDKQLKRSDIGAVLSVQLPELVQRLTMSISLKMIILPVLSYRRRERLPATDSEIRRAWNNLRQIQEAKDVLRQFIADNFKLEDLL